MLWSNDCLPIFLAATCPFDTFFNQNGPEWDRMFFYQEGTSEMHIAQQLLEQRRYEDIIPPLKISLSKLPNTFTICWIFFNVEQWYNLQNDLQGCMRLSFLVQRL